MNSSLVITTEGLPLGLASIRFWNRKKFKGCNASKKKINPTRIPIEEKESFRWLENLKQSSDLLAHPENCVYESWDLRSIFYKTIAPERKLLSHETLSFSGKNSHLKDMLESPLTKPAPPVGKRSIRGDRIMIPKGGGSDKWHQVFVFGA